jgi:hypothetical protein
VGGKAVGTMPHGSAAKNSHFIAFDCATRIEPAKARIADIASCVAMPDSSRAPTAQREFGILPSPQKCNY